jgi:hypothetical protein
VSHLLDAGQATRELFSRDVASTVAGMNPYEVR